MARTLPKTATSHSALLFGCVPVHERCLTTRLAYGVSRSRARERESVDCAASPLPKTDTRVPFRERCVSRASLAPRGWGAVQSRLSRKSRGWRVGSWIVLGVAVLVAAWAVFAFNRLVRLRNQMRSAWADIDVQLTRR